MEGKLKMSDEGESAEFFAYRWLNKKIPGRLLFGILTALNEVLRMPQGEINVFRLFFVFFFRSKA